MSPRRRRRCLMAAALSWGMVVSPGCSETAGGGRAEPDASSATDAGRSDRADAAAQGGSDTSPVAQDDARVGSDAHADAGPHGLADAFVPLDAGAEVAADVTPDVGPLGPSSCARVPSDNPTRDGRRAFLDMTIVAGGFAEHEAQRVYVFTRDYNLKTPLGYGSAVVQAGAFQLTFPEGYARFSYQPMFYFIDVNGDGRCDEAAGDHPGYMVSSGWNPVANEPLMHGLHHTHVPDVRGERVCDVLNACR